MLIQTICFSNLQKLSGKSKDMLTLSCNWNHQDICHNKAINFYMGFSTISFQVVLFSKITKRQLGKWYLPIQYLGTQYLSNFCLSLEDQYTCQLATP